MKLFRQSSVKPSRTARIIFILQQRSNSKWFFPGAGFFPFADFAAPFLPNQLLLMSLSALNPKRRIQLGATFVFASGLGAFAVSVLIANLSPANALNIIAPEIMESAQWKTANEYVAQYGLIALLMLSFLPWTPRTAVIATAAAGFEPLAIGASVMIGRIVPIFLYAWLGSEAQKISLRWKRLRVLLLEVESLSKESFSFKSSTKLD